MHSKAVGDINEYGRERAVNGGVYTFRCRIFVIAPSACIGARGDSTRPERRVFGDE